MTTIERLKQSAYNYGLCQAQLESALGCYAPDALVSALLVNVQDAERSLTRVAKEHFNNVYDGESE